MDKKIKTSIENKPKETFSVSELYDKLLLLEPKSITKYVPKDATEQKEAFLRGEIHNPKHDYDRLDNLNFKEAKTNIDIIGKNILDSSELNPKFYPVYDQFIDDYYKKTELLELAYSYNHAQSNEDKAKAKDEYMKLNVELYGEPERGVYKSLLTEKLKVISEKNLIGDAEKIREELFNMIDFDGNIETPERFRPSTETVEWMKGVAESLYSSMLSHVPEDRDSFGVEDAQEIFTEIIRDEFGESARDWKVNIEDAKSINVKSTEKRIVIPRDRGTLSRDQLQKLVVHEMGVHMLRAVAGSETDLQPFANGFNNYYDSEEGLGVIMEQALSGKASERGIDHYITSGLVYWDKKDFRDTFEIKWRIALLEKINNNGAELSSEQIKKARNVSYGQTMRIMRGTDELPWFKDLAYYRGSTDTWKYLEKIKGDDLQFMFVLLGKANPADSDHSRIMYETSTV